MVGSAASALVLFAQKIFLPETIAVGGWTSLILTLIFFGGVITFLVGIALEYLSLLVMNANGKPIFFTVDRHTDQLIRNYFSPDKL